MKHVKNKMISTKLRIKTLETCTPPLLTYGAPTWALTTGQLEKLRATQRSIERSILNIRKSKKVRNNTIGAKTKMKDIGYIMMRVKMSYAGYMIRIEEERWNEIL